MLTPERLDDAAHIAAAELRERISKRVSGICNVELGGLLGQSASLSLAHRAGEKAVQLAGFDEDQPAFEYDPYMTERVSAVMRRTLFGRQRREYVPQLVFRPLQGWLEKNGLIVRSGTNSL
jgi:hypothetical protein